MKAGRVLFVIALGIGVAAMLGLDKSSIRGEDSISPPVDTPNSHVAIGNGGGVPFTKMGKVAAVPLPPVEEEFPSPGIKLRVPPRVSAEMRWLYAEIGGRLSDLKVQPPERGRHFEWMDQYQAKLKEWQGEIRSWERGPAGILVRIKVWPNVSVPDMPPTTGFCDYFLEDYFYCN